MKLLATTLALIALSACGSNVPDECIELREFWEDCHQQLTNAGLEMSCQDEYSTDWYDENGDPTDLYFEEAISSAVVCKSADQVEASCVSGVDAEANGTGEPASGPINTTESDEFQGYIDDSDCDGVINFIDPSGS
jgi:hypothetical protein